SLPELKPAIISFLEQDQTLVIVLDSENQHAMAEQRRFFFELAKFGISSPVIIMRKYPVLANDEFQIYAATDVGGLLIDGLGDGILLNTELWNNEGREKLIDYLK